MVSEIKSPAPTVKGTKNDIIVKRRGGGTLIDSRPIFSSDANYVFLNCGWGVRIFSVRTGECVKTCDAGTKKESVVSIFLYEDQPSAITSNGTFLSWEIKTGKKLRKQHFDIGKGCVATNAFLVPNLLSSDVLELCIVTFDQTKSELQLNFFGLNEKQRIQHPLDKTIISDINIKQGISFGGPEENKIIASISTRGLNIFALNGKSQVVGINPGENRVWTCVRVHSSDYPVAAGDSTGRVVLFRTPFRIGKKNPQAIYHWHTLPCRDIALTPAGSLMYTGGGENVLVKWNLENPQVRNYLPRLSAEITFIEISKNFEYVAIATLDNSVKVIDPQSRLICVLQELSWGVLPTPDTPLFPAGLSFDPRSRGVILNGRPGHLQFYSPMTETLLFNLDVTIRNYLTQERNKVIYNTEVTGSCISSDGAWLATLETREDPTVRLEQRLKFWEYNVDKKCFSLNSSIEGPHNGKTHHFRFRPGSKSLSMSNPTSVNYMLVTTGNDAKFRIWTPNEIDSIYRKGVVWGCDNTCFYRQKECGPLSFSEDGTIVGVGFEACLVLWDLTELKVTATLNTPSNEKHIRFVEFGQFESFCEIVCATEDEIYVWNLMTLQLSWKFPINVSLLVQDVASSHFAVFSRNNEVFIFKPKSPEIVYSKKRVCDRNGIALSALFVPRQRHLSNVPSWMQNSQLFYINNNQELLCLESESESEESYSLMLGQDVIEATPFSSLLAAQVESEVKKSKPLKQNVGYGILGSAAISQFLKYPAHTVPAMSLMCSSFLQSLIVTNNQETEKMEVDESDEGLAESVSLSSEEEDSVQSKMSPKSKHKTSPEKSNNEDRLSKAEKLSIFFKDLEKDEDEFLFDDSRVTAREEKFFIDGI
ncbi:WD repeat-containing protein 75 [Halyomorpha halys]|uniref:WD repeat-containing protein 75 n=1 Tax=Halyomorpha halys TaxID=286706 RepID=UPI0006D51615|nr:WD repeat-containing protein 75 [Halyomorpha halys]